MKPRHALGRTARIGGRAAGVTTRALGRRLYAGVRRDPEVRARAEARTAADVAQALGDLRGGVAKLGQLLSYVDHRVPPVLRESLAALREDAPVMAPELASAVVAEELGRDPGEAFGEWDPVPIAAASIGQVHRAMLADGRAVAVKVQYPGAREALIADLASMDVLHALLRPMFGRLDARPIIAELVDRLPEELDYTIEAAHQRHLADLWAGHPHIHVPEVVEELSTGRVLVSELVDGATFAEACTWSAEERNLAGETIYRWMEDNLYRHHLVHGDMHPGNLRLHRGGRVTFLDFGLVDRFDDHQMVAITAAARSRVTEAPPEDFARTVVSGGYLPSDHGLAFEDVEAYFAPFLDVETTPGASTITPERAAGLIDGYLGTDDDVAAVVEKVAIPRRDVILNRANMGTIGLLAQLRATAEWRRIAAESWPWPTDDAPTSPLGVAHQEWRDA